jgi:CheY-like chemotaxis protein
VDNNEPAKARNSLAEVSSSSQRLLEMLNDVLDISNIEEGRLYLKEERFLLHETMLDTAQAVADKATEKNQHFTNNIAMLPKIWVIGDKMRLKQVLVNLLENAIEFTPAKGKISFEVNCQHEDENRARFAFTITDNGVGIASERIPTLFEFFANDTGASYDNGNDGSAGRNGNGSAGRNGGGGAGHNSGGGAGHNGGGGFGLAISKYLVGAMGGQIDVSSALGMGSVFSFILSFDKATGDGKLNTDLPTVVPDLTGRRILSVEDIEINRLVLRELLAETQVTIEEAEDGLEAIERFRKSPVGYYDLVFMDLLMPRMGGHEAAREIRNLNRADAKTIPIVAISANAYDSDKHKSLAAGMNEHLAKPIDYAAALDVLSKYVVQTPRDLTSASS